MIRFALFATQIGPCTVAWGVRGIVWLQLPQDDDVSARRRAVHRYPEAVEAKPPPGIDLAIRDIMALLAGEAVDLARIDLDMSEVPDFDRRVYQAARSVPVGHTATYGDIARRIGEPGAARAVGAALGRNPFPIVVPCHRVLAANGKTGGFSARGGVATKLRMLTIEHAHCGDTPTLFDEHGGLPFRAA
jgi:methylated-DNA-[protein]-cysteine S-methyltransferase